MYLKSVLAILFFVSLTFTADASSSCHHKECGINKEWTECGTACPATCDDPNPEACTLQCVEGCVCSSGLVLDSAGNCINPDECPNHSHY